MNSDSLNILTCLNTDPQPLDFVVPGLIAGDVGILSSPGGTGKSFFALQLALAIATPFPDANLLDLDIGGAYGRVAYWALEDADIVLHHRLRALGRVLPDDLHEEVALRLTVHTRSGLDIMQPADFQLVQADGDGARLIVIDTLSMAHTEDENSNPAMARVLRQLRMLARSTGAAVIVLHHVSKGALLAGRGSEAVASRGASAITDNARWGAALAVMTEAEALEQDIEVSKRRQYVRFDVTKNNYSAPVDTHWLRRGPGGVLRPSHHWPKEDTKEGGNDEFH